MVRALGIRWRVRRVRQVTMTFNRQGLAMYVHIQQSVGARCCCTNIDPVILKPKNHKNSQKLWTSRNWRKFHGQTCSWGTQS